MMNENQILAEVKKAIDLYLDKTYEVKDLYSHILTIIKDHSTTGEMHKEQLERLLFKVHEVRNTQQLYYSGHKSKLAECKRLESELDHKYKYLVSHGGYSIDRFIKSQAQNQPDLFHGQKR